MIEGGGEAGGLALFSPWGNVVMYYDSFSPYPGLYILVQDVGRPYPGLIGAI